MNELALFAGMGGGILGGQLLGWHTVCAVEINDYCRRILMQRQDDGCLEPFPIWDDITTFDGKPWAGCVDIVTGGFPCQDISAAGRGAGIDGERSGLWREMARVIGEVRPRYVLVENSPVLTVRGLGTVLGDLAALGYDAEWGVLGAADLGAPHKRDRIWIVGHALRDRRETDHGGNLYRTATGTVRHRRPDGKSSNRGLEAQALWQTPVADDAVDRKAGKWNSRGEPKLSAQVMMWPTPISTDYKAGCGKTGNRSSEKSAKAGWKLTEAVALWPTPTVHGNYNRKGASPNSGDGLATAVANRQTPTIWNGLAGDVDGFLKASELPDLVARNAVNSNRTLPTPTHHKGLGQDHNRTALEHTQTGHLTPPKRLNPAWVEWLMGVPHGWTDLKPLAMDKFQEWWQQHSPHCIED